MATVVFVLLNLIFPGGPWWAAFLYAVPANAIVITVLSSVWKYRIANFVSVTVIVWSVLACIYVTTLLVMSRLGVGDDSRLWLLFLLGIPLQALEVLWCFFRWTLFRGRGTGRQKVGRKGQGRPEVLRRSGGKDHAVLSL